ncbi:Inherit from NOG: sulfotransferase [Seminavis robusta]|uniref:protein-tyrosine sulfotransferase n=1 Tax=Seminavis robusta TaxID=568900 RepID=A0A9N8E5F4_9STRA|nr:Inherit from NOG: sulfotransferase [Seminavis robusta]|eukprot:Sro536_g162180.1 Inherit from NOG: sulfotransferase (789) ;mRNA; f:34191-36964
MTDDKGVSDADAPLKEEEKSQKRDNDTVKGNADVAKTAVAAEEIIISSPSPSVSFSLLVFWVLPVLFLAIASHHVIDTKTPPKAIFPPNRQGMSVNLNTAGITTDSKSSSASREKPGKMMLKKKPKPPSPTPRRSPKPSPLPTAHTNWPTSYREAVETIQERNRKIPRIGTSRQGSGNGPTSSKKETGKRPSSTPTRSKKKPDNGINRDPMRKQYEDRIDKFREEYQNDPENVFKAIKLADSLRLYDVSYHDGGTKQPEALETYEKVIQMTVAKREKMIEEGKETDKSLAATTNVNDEVMMDYTQKSVDGLLCSLYTAKGKVFFMSNMFERAVESYSKCLEIAPLYLDALSSRGSSEIILGNYEAAGQDLMRTIENDTQNLFNDAYTGLARILQAKENVLPEGWAPIIQKLDDLIPSLEGMISSVPGEDGRKVVANTLNRLHHVMFTYHDVKTKDTTEAWEHLTRSYKHKMSALPAWQSGFEKQKITQTMQIFHRGFWPSDVGSKSEVPVFIVGFVRSGSTLLERVLDAHPNIVGTGEDSVFNGKLDRIRNEIVEASVLGDPSKLAETVERQANMVVSEMKERWEMIEANTAKAPEAEAGAESAEPRRFVDKMLNNYYNIGFIHMLFPKALILHVIREPMDTIFSAYKHEFPPGTLDYTSDFSSLAELYHSYRDLMDHWDKELPGRVTHVRYEDLVHDMPGMAKSIIQATGLEWHDDVLSFHKKKHAVNTLSTTQVRKGIYKHSLQSWRKYEEQLQPLVDLIGDRVDPNRETTLPGYVKPEPVEEAAE